MKKHKKPKVKWWHRDLAYRLYLAIEHAAPSMTEFERWAEEFALLEASWTLGSLGDPFEKIDSLLNWIEGPPQQQLLAVIGVHDAKSFRERFASLRALREVIWQIAPDLDPVDEPDDDPGDDVEPDESSPTELPAIISEEAPDEHAA